MKVVEYWHETIKNYRYDGDVSVSSMMITTHNSLCSTRAYHLCIDLARMPLLGNVACNFKKIPMLTQDLSRNA